MTSSKSIIANAISSAEEAFPRRLTNSHVLISEGWKYCANNFFPHKSGHLIWRNSADLFSSTMPQLIKLQRKY